MNQPTLDDTLRTTCFELCAVEVEVGSVGALVQLPGDSPQALGGWSFADSVISSRTNARGAPCKTLVVAFMRPMIDGAVGVAPAVKAPGMPNVAIAPGRPTVPASAHARRNQGALPQPPKPLVVTPAEAPRPAQANVATVTGGTVQPVAGPSVSQAPTAAAAPPAPAPTELDCVCPEPAPAIFNPSAAAVPCGQCGKWIQQTPAAETAAAQ